MKEEIIKTINETLNMIAEHIEYMKANKSSDAEEITKVENQLATIEAMLNNINTIE